MTERTTVTKEELHIEMNKLRDTLDRWRAATQAQMDDLKAETKKHSKTIYGNGEPGLDEVARTNRSMILSNAETTKEIQKFMENFRPVLVFYKVGVWLASIVGVSVIALIWSIITHTVTLVKP